MLTRSACRFELDNDVALRVEAAGIAHIGIVVSRGINVVVLGPADAFEMNADRCSSGPGGRRYADNARLNCEIRLRERFVAVAKLQSMTSAEIFGNCHGKLECSVGFDRHFLNQFVLRRESTSAHAIADIGLPYQIER